MQNSSVLLDAALGQIHSLRQTARALLRLQVVDPKGDERERGEEKARERRKAHRRLTRIYGFVGLANKESARETGFRRATLSSTGLADGIACCR